EMPHLLDPATGEVQLITQRWVYDRAREALGRSPDGGATALVEEDITRPKADGGHVLQIKVRSNQYGDTRQVTACSSDCYDPAWSPDGTWIAYVGKDLLDEEIYRVNLDGSVVTQLTFNDWESDKHPTWSPDGSQIVFFSNRTGKNQIWIMNADGSGQRNLSNNDYNDWNPIWIRP
ncbi:MAG: PD40 domain-containing protein, partial [Caldilineaceae bacterium]|nr:PD40 domain-containing protein [Caldilineaceae bacterium]